MGKTTYCTVLIGCLSKENTAKLPHLLQISVWTQPATGMQLSKCDPNLLLTTYCLLFITIDDLDTVFTAMVDSGATNSFVHSKVV